MFPKMIHLKHREADVAMFSTSLNIKMCVV